MGAHISIPMYQRSLPQRYRLVGEKCGNCGSINFPLKAVCKYCREGREFTPYQLSGRGVLYSYTIIAGGGAPPEFEDYATIKGEYPVGIVQLEEGPRIIAQLIVDNKENIAIGREVEATFRRIYVEEEVIRYGFKFVVK